MSSYFLISNFLQYKVSNNSNLQLIEDVFTKNKTEENTEKTIIDWDKLSNINTDIIGWIKINDTNIDYPILKDTDNLKYLKHSFGGKRFNIYAK